MNFIQILILGLVQGAAELLPVSSSAHVIVAEKLMGIDPSSPEATFLLVMLHTGTMFAVIAYFWKSWVDHYFSDAARLGSAVTNIIVATALTGIVFLVLREIIKKTVLHGQPKADVEDLFSYLPLIAGALFAAGVLIFYSGSREEKDRGTGGIDWIGAAIVGAVQGLCLPFRGFSRSGGTISTGLLLGIERRQIEEFSFALAVVLTPLVVGRELWRLLKAHPEFKQSGELVKLLTPGLVGMVCAFVAGYLALKLLSSLLESGRWKFFGYYCIVAALAVGAMAYAEPTIPPTEQISNDSGTVEAPTPAPAPAPTDTATPVQPVAPATNAPAVQLVPAATNAPPIAPVNASSVNSQPVNPAAAAPSTNAIVPAVTNAPAQ